MLQDGNRDDLGRRPYPVVGIGAAGDSAGALRELLGALDGTRIAVVIVEAVADGSAAALAPALRAALGDRLLDAADGVAIVVLADPHGALRLAERALTASAAGLPLSAGVNHGAVRLLGNGNAEAMVGDGIAVAASIAEFAAPSQLRTSRALREALADAHPGLESSLVHKGSSTDASLRSHELFTLDHGAQERRSRRYAALSVLAFFTFITASLAWRVSEQGQEAFVHGMAVKYRDTALKSERYVRGLVQKVKLQ